MNQKKAIQPQTAEELKKTALIYWPKEIAEKEKNLSAVPLLLKTQESFIGVLKLANASHDAWIKALRLNKELYPQSLDGAGNFERNSALQSIIEASDCAVNFSKGDIARLIRTMKNPSNKMAHRSNSDYSLRIRKHNGLKLEIGFDFKSKARVYLFHLPHLTKSSARLNDRTFGKYLDDFLSVNLHEDALFAFISDTKSALQIIPILRNRLKYRLWVAIEREFPFQRKDYLPDNHAAITIFGKNKKQFKHSKVQIQYTVCPSCGKTTKDYGGKKHLYSPYGTLMTDVWRDIKIKEEGFPEEIVKRLSDLFATEPFVELVYFDLRNQSDFYCSASPFFENPTVSTD